MPACPDVIASVLADFSEPDVLEEAAARVQTPDNVLGLLVRPINRNEIAVLEARGCRADNWQQIQVAEDFDPFRVRRTHLIGDCVLGRFSGDVEVQPGMELPRGIYDSTLINCQVGNDCLVENVRFASGVVIERQAVLFDVGSITCSTGVHFGCGHEIHVGPEVGGRAIPVWGSLTIPHAACLARHRDDAAQLAAVHAGWQNYLTRIASDKSWICRGAVVRQPFAFKTRGLVRRRWSIRQLSCAMWPSQLPTNQ